MSDTDNLALCSIYSNYHYPTSVRNLQPPSVLFQQLVNLPSEILQLIIVKLSECNGGLQTILSLRAASSITKEWIDDRPSETLKRRLYMNTQINVPLKAECIKRFLSAPPPIPVPSLQLTKSEDNKTTQIDLLRSFYFTEETQLIWEEFINFWSSRLKVIEISCPDAPLKDQQLQLFFSSCPFLEVIRTTVSVDNILHNHSSVLKELVLRNKAWQSYADEGRIEKIIDKILLLKCNLKLLELPINSAPEMRSIMRFIAATSQDSTLRMTLDVHMTVSPYDRAINDERRLFYNFARTVVSSKSDIRIANLSDSLILDMEEHAGLEVTKAFLCKVIHVSEIVHFLDRNERPRVADFVNLRRLDRIIPKIYEQTGTNDEIYPRSLRRIGTFGCLDQCIIRSLPNWLTCLEIILHSWENTKEFVESLIAIDKHFSALRKFKLADGFVKNKVILGKESNQYVNSFKNLRSLKLDLNFHYEDTSECSRYILKDILKLNLSLQKVHLASSFNTPYYPLVLHSDFTRLITEGTLKYSLVHVSFGRFQFQDDNDKITLISLAQDNLREHRKNHAITNTKCYCFDKFE